MSVRNMSPSLQRSRSALDHLGIDVAARLLLAGSGSSASSEMRRNY
jgi:hypothetical protein